MSQVCHGALGKVRVDRRRMVTKATEPLSSIPKMIILSLPAFHEYGG